MTIRYLWYGSVGPIIYDDTKVYKGEGVYMEALRTTGTLLLEGTPFQLDHAIRLRDLIVIEDESYHLLALKVAIDLTATGQTVLETVSSSEVHLPLRFIVRLKTVTALTSVPTIQVGKTGNLDCYVFDEILTGLTTVNDCFVGIIGGKIPAAVAAEDIIFNVATAAVASVYSADLYLYGAEL